EENLKVDKKVSSFVLPIGATINMDGTTMYQAVAAVFIAQVLGYDLTLMDQLAIVLTATLAGIGSAAVPGAGILMLVIVLESVGVDPAGIALIFAVDRPLDMCRTVVNVTGDIVVATIVQRFSSKEGATDVVTPIEYRFSLFFSWCDRVFFHNTLDDLRQFVDSILRDVHASGSTCLPHHGIGTAIDSFHNNMSVSHALFAYGARISAIVPRII